MKKHAKRIISIISLIAVTALFIWFMQITVTNRDDNDLRSLKSFYKEDRDSLDVVILGSSEVMSGYSAAEAYKEAGYTSFPYAFTINSVPLWKYELEDIERTQHPQILFVETNGVLYEDDEYVYSRNCINALGESMPMSLNRIRCAFDLSNHPMERLIPFIKYHYKWKDILDLSENTNLMLMEQDYARLRGVNSFLYKKKYSTAMDFPPDDTVGELNPNAEAEFAEFLEVCKKSDIEKIVFIEFPHVMGNEELYKRQQRANRAAEMIKEAGFDYIDLTNEGEAIGLDYENDFYDEHHLLAPGEKKLSHYMADLIMNRYGLQPKEQTEKNKAGWEDSAELIGRFYDEYDRYTKEHADDPYAKAEHLLAENLETMKVIGGK